MINQWLLLLSLAILALACIYGFRSHGLTEQQRERNWEKKEAAWSVERQQLLDRIMYMADKPWEVPQSEEVDDYVEPEYHDPTMIPIPNDYDYLPIETV